METAVLFYKIEKEMVTAEDYVMWAYSMLEKGFSSPSLGILASFDKGSNLFEVEGYFHKSCRELEIDTAPGYEVCARAYMRVLAEEIGKREQPSEVYELAYEMFHIVRELDYPEDLMVWYDISEKIDGVLYDPANSTIDSAGLILLIKRTAKS
ncbi:hypothetical protein [Halobacillus salinus]|uniref:hypothetical protein n=1 Tax=Halobacillus salinus TaxID=192814 RepID=UPI0009A7AEAF|nr:hypothetical protein [Halobacillus salinus]